MAAQQGLMYGCVAASVERATHSEIAGGVRRCLMAVDGIWCAHLPFWCAMCVVHVLSLLMLLMLLLLLLLLSDIAI